MADYIFEIPIGTTGNTYNANIFKHFQFYNGVVTDAEEYKTDPVFFFSFCGYGDYGLYVRSIADEATVRGESEYDGRIAISVERIQTVNYIRAYRGTAAEYEDGARYSGKVDGSTETPDFEPHTPFSDASQLPYGGYGSWASAQYYNILEWILCTNIPIFETDTEAFAYIGGASNLHRAINYDYPAESEGEDFLINNVWAHGTWTPTGLTGMQGQNFRLVRGKLIEGGRIAFYEIPGISGGALKYGVNYGNSSFEGLQYSIDGVNWIDSSVFPFEYFYRERTNELGEFDFGLSFYSQIPVFANDETAEKYINEDPSVTIEDAINWPQISGEYPSDTPTGSPLPATVFGDVKLKGFFSQQYICDSTCLSALADDLFDTSQGGIWELMKKGLDMYQGSMDAVMGLSFWPFDVTSLIGAGNYSPAQYIWLGGYGWETAGHGSCNQIIYASGYKDIGILRVTPKFRNWRDYEPYTKLYVSIPYCGTYQLDLARYMGKDIRFRYFIDTRTNGCICALIADGYLMDYFNGQMGVTMPIVLTDYSAYMNAQMQVLLQGGGQAMSDVMSSYNSAQGIASMGGAAGLVGGLVAGGLPVAMGGAVTGAKTVYGLTQNNINNFNKTKGGSSSMINCFLPQTIDLIFEYQEDIYYNEDTRRSSIATDYYPYFGQPSMKSGQINTFTGYLKCQAVKLECGIATERERERLKQMLLSGIYI